MSLSCPVCEQETFFTWSDLSHPVRNGWVSVMTRQTGEALIESASREDSMMEHTRCACCNSAIDPYESVHQERIVLDDNYENMTHDEFTNMINEYHNGDINHWLNS